jgi:hypothetical protein
MNINCLIYTTSKSVFFFEDLEYIKECLMQARGRTDVTFKVQYISPPTDVPTIRDSKFGVRPSWDWFDQKFVDPVRGEYDTVAFHFTEYYRTKWGINRWLGGLYHRDQDGVLDFWLCADNKQARNYDFSEFTRIFIHEMAHGDARYTGEHNDEVHMYDYELHKIHEFHKLIDYTDYNIKLKIVNLLTQIVALYNKLIWRRSK